MSARMAQLRDSFHGLAGRFSPVWDAQEVADFILSPAATSGSSHAAKFVLSVWSGGGEVSWTEDGVAEVDEWRWPWKCLPFDTHRALKAWDDSHRRAFSAWVVEPWWP